MDRGCYYSNSARNDSISTYSDVPDRSVLVDFCHHLFSSRNAAEVPDHVTGVVGNLIAGSTRTTASTLVELVTFYTTETSHKTENGDGKNFKKIL